MHNSLNRGHCGIRLARLRRLVFLALLGCTLAACDPSPGANVKPGDADYPQHNPRPQKLIAVRVIASPTITPQFELEYSSTPSVILHPAPDAPKWDCEYSPPMSGAGPFEYSASEPVTFRRDGDVYVGSFARDAVMPGRCGWHVTFLDFSTSRTTVTTSHFFGDETETLHSSGVRLDTNQSRASGNAAKEVLFDVWCVRYPAHLNPAQPEACGSLSDLVHLYPNIVSATALERVPADQRNDADATLSPETTSITVRIHNVEATSSVDTNNK